jgi:hypothetical protein
MADLAPPDDSDVRDALAEALAGSGMPEPLLVCRRPSPYRTSFPLEELEVELAGGERRRLAFKRLDWGELDERARLAKPRFLHEPSRELRVYAELLAGIGGPPRCFGATVEPGAGRHWLFVEWVEGRELYQVGERGLWEEAAAWLARFHAEMAPELDRRRGEAPLLEHDAAFYRRWMERARELRGEGEGGTERRRALAWLGERHEAVVEALAALPRTVVHGEFYASNVLVAEEGGSVRVAPVDWELAAIGPGLGDLAALVAGEWSEGDRAAIVSAYRAGVDRDFTDRELGLARLQAAIQWLGWAPPEWVPPEGQRNDWLAEAVALAEELGL